jgi:hypothetical protein
MKGYKLAVKPKPVSAPRVSFYDYHRLPAQRSLLNYRACSITDTVGGGASQPDHAAILVDDSELEPVVFLRARGFCRSSLLLLPRCSGNGRGRYGFAPGITQCNSSYRQGRGHSRLIAHKDIGTSLDQIAGTAAMDVHIPQAMGRLAVD